MGASKPDLVPFRWTPRNPNRETTGQRKRGVGKALGTPYLPWQSDLADVWGEIDPATGLPWYRTMVLIGLRQIGKTTFVRADQAETCIFRPNALVRYTAQNRLMGVNRLERDFYRPIRDSALAIFLDTRVGNAKRGTPGWSAKTGDEHIEFMTGSRWETDAVKEDSGHGPPLTKGVIDEAFSHIDARVEQAMRPALQTIPGSQLMVASAAGNAKSLYLAGKRAAELARFDSLVEQYGPMGPTRSRTLYVEFAAPADADRADPLTWWTYHPGLNGGLVTEDTIQADFEAFADKPEEFDRAYLGWWPSAKNEEWVIPEASLRACFEPDEDLNWSGSPVYGIDVAPDRSVATIAIAAGAPNTRAWVEVPRQDVGTAWVVDAACRMRDGSSKVEGLGGRLVVLDGAGPAASLAPDLRKAGFEVVELGARELNAACGALYDDVVQTNLTHSGDPELYAAVKAAAKAPSGDSWRWGRKRSLEDITALYAVTLARHGYVTRAPADYDPLASVIGPTEMEDA